MYLVNAQQMRIMDRFAMGKIGIHRIALMKAASSQVVSEVKNLVRGKCSFLLATCRD